MFHPDKPLPPPPPPHRSADDAASGSTARNTATGSADKKNLVSNRIAQLAAQTDIPKAKAAPPKLPAKPTHLGRTSGSGTTSAVKPIKEKNNNESTSDEPKLSTSATRLMFERIAADAEGHRPTIVRPKPPAKVTTSSNKPAVLLPNKPKAVVETPQSLPPPVYSSVARKKEPSAALGNTTSVKALRNQLSSQLNFGGGRAPVAVTNNQIAPAVADVPSSAPTLVRPDKSHYATTAATFDPSYESNRRSKSPPARPPPPKLKHGRSLNELEPHAIAVFSFKAQQRDELSCQKGDTILLKRKVNDDWYYGQNKSGGAFGIIPTSFLDIKLPPEDVAGSAKPSSPDIDSGNESMSSQPNYVDSGPRCVALYAYQGGHPEDLTFRQNDVIRRTDAVSPPKAITNSVSPKLNRNGQSPPARPPPPRTKQYNGLLRDVSEEWLEGQGADGKQGLFPKQFVRIVEELPNEENQPISMEAIYDYRSSNPGDLSFQAGDEIVEIERVNDDWSRGYLKCYPGNIGLYPNNFVQVHTSGKGHSSVQPPSTAVAASPPSSSQMDCVATALYDFHGDNPTDLWFSAGDRIRVIEQVNDDWLKGKLILDMVNTKSFPPGIFPKNFVRFD